MINQEFSAFGPWIIEIQDDDQIPPLFRGMAPAPGDCKLLLKIPRDIDRRHAKPGMDLYEHLLGITDTHLVILSRTDQGRVEAKEHPLEGIKAVEVSHNLLRGELILYLGTQRVGIRFNTVSADSIGDFIALLRQRLPAGGTAKTTGSSRASGLKDQPEKQVLPQAELSYFYANLQERFGRSEGRLRVLLHQHDVLLRRTAGLFEPLIRLLFPHRIGETMVLEASQELILVRRYENIKTDRIVDNGYRILYLPVDSLERFTLEPSTDYPEVLWVTVFSGSSLLHLPLTQGNPFLPALQLWAEARGITWDSRA